MWFGVVSYVVGMVSLVWKYYIYMISIYGWLFAFLWLLT